MIDQENELQTEEELDDTPYVEFDISVSPADPTLELLSAQIERGDILIPFYQRKFVWKIEQASRLIESFLMGLPVPQIFFYVNDEDQLEVIDGQQRLKSVSYFFEGLFGEEDGKGKRPVFRLRGLAERSEYNGKKFSELSARDQRKLRNSTLRAIHVKQLKPRVNSDSVFHIFQRLNTGGTQLRPQEIRNAIYRGQIVDSLRSLNENQHWRKVLGAPTADNSQKDMELLLRLFSLFEDWDEYEKPMLSYLNRVMGENRNFDTKKARDFKEEFARACRVVSDAFEKPFRPRGVLNSAVLEAVMVTLLENNEIDSVRLKGRYSRLIGDTGFKGSITGATTDTAVLRARIRRAKELL